MRSQDDASGPIRDAHEQVNEIITGLPPGVYKRLRTGRRTMLTGRSEQELHTALASNDWSVRVAAVQALSARGGQAAIAQIVGALQDEHEAVRASAARALGKQHTQLLIEPLLLALHDPAWLVRATAAQALGKIGAHVPIEPLLLALRDDDESVRAAAATALGAQGEQSPVAPLLHALHDPAWHVREMAVLALGPRMPAGSLLIVLHDEDASVRKAALSLQQAHQQRADSPAAPDAARLPATSQVSMSRDRSLVAMTMTPIDKVGTWELQDEATHAVQQMPSRYPRRGLLLTLRSLLLCGWCLLIAYLVYCTWALYQDISPGPALTVLCLPLLCGCLWATGDSIYERRKMHGGENIDESEQEERYQPTHILDYEDDERPTRGPSRRAALVGLAATVIAINGIAWFSLTRSRQQVTTTAAAPGRLLAILNNGDGPVLALAWSPDGQHIALAGRGLKLWVVATNQYIPIDLGTFSATLAVAWSANGKYVVSGGNDATAEVWDASTGKVVSTYNGQNAAIHSLAWASDGRHIISSSADSTVSVWEAMTDRTTHLYQGNTGSVASVAWSPDGSRFASAGQDNLVWVRDFATNKLIYSNIAFYYNQDACPCQLDGRGLVWSPDSSLLAYGTPDGKVHIVQVTQQRVVLTYQGHSAAINDLSWSPGGLYIASASEDHTVQIWEATTGRTTLVYKGHTSGVMSVKWSPDGSRVVSASPEDHTAQVWLAL